jgi:transcriptional regulator
MYAILSPTITAAQGVAVLLHLTGKWKPWHASTMPPSGDAPRVDILPGTLDAIVLRTLTSLGPQHAYGIAARIEQVADKSVRLNQGTLYPALVRLEQRGWIEGTWRTTENNREARYYAITKSGSRALAKQAEWWQRSADLVNRLLSSET